MRVTVLDFYLLGLKAKIKVVFIRSHCCYGNLLCHVYTSSGCNDSAYSKSWKVLETVASNLKPNLIFSRSLFSCCGTLFFYNNV